MFRRLHRRWRHTALITGALAGCGNTDSWVDAHAADGWSAQYADAANSSYADVAGAEALRLDWSRSVKGDLGAAGGARVRTTISPSTPRRRPAAR